ncbi:MAG: hypothetical protein Q3962_00735 [Corynebacterium sp.]|nr:hypothetical protein [Corynebacterium sp.]
MKKFSRSAIAVVTATAVAFSGVAAVGNAHNFAFAADSDSTTVAGAGSLVPNKVLTNSGSAISQAVYAYAGTNIKDNQHTILAIGDTLEVDWTLNVPTDSQGTSLKLANVDLAGWTRATTVTFADGTNEQLDAATLDKTYTKNVAKVAFVYTQTLNDTNYTTASFVPSTDFSVQVGNTVYKKTDNGMPIYTLPTTGNYAYATATVTLLNNAADKVKVKLWKNGGTEPTDYNTPVNNAVTLAGYKDVQGKYFYKLADGSYYSPSSAAISFTNLTSDDATNSISIDGNKLANLDAFGTATKYFGDSADVTSLQKAYLDDATKSVAQYNLGKINSDAAVHNWSGVAQALNLSVGQYNVTAQSDAAASTRTSANNFLATVTKGAETDHPSALADTVTNNSVSDINKAVSDALVDYAFAKSGFDGLTPAQLEAYKTKAKNGDNAAKTAALTDAAKANEVLSAARTALKTYGGTTDSSNDLSNAYSKAHDDLRAAVLETNPDLDKVKSLTDQLNTLGAQWNQWNGLADLSLSKAQIESLRSDYVKATTDGDRTNVMTKANNLAAAVAAAKTARDGFASQQSSDDYKNASTESKNAVIDAYNALNKLVDSSTDQAAIDKAVTDYKAALAKLTPASDNTETPTTNDNETPAAPSTAPKASGSSWWLLSIPAIIAAIVGVRWVNWFQLNPGWVGNPPMWWFYSNFPPAGQ